MKQSIIGFTFIMIAIIFFTTAVFSDNYSFLDDTAGQYFTDEDWQIFLEAENTALSHYGDGKKLVWKNPNTGANGYFIPSSTTKKNGMLCRDLTIYNNANNREGKATLLFCHEKQGWKGV